MSIESTALQVILANFDTSECDKTKICALHPPTCAQGPIENCDYAFSYAPLDGEPKRYDMELYTRRPEARLNYVSVGFSNDQVMVCLPGQWPLRHGRSGRGPGHSLRFCRRPACGGAPFTEPTGNKGEHAHQSGILPFCTTLACALRKLTLPLCR